MEVSSLWTSISTRKSESKNVSSMSFSDLFLNKESSKFSSKKRSSTKNHSLGQVWDLKTCLGLNDPSCLLTILGIRFGFSNTGGGFGSGLALVYLLEASVVKFLFYKNLILQPSKNLNIIFRSLGLLDILGKILQVRCYVYKTRPEID